MEQKPQKAPPNEPFDTIEGTLQRFTFRNAESGFAVIRFATDGGSGALSAVGQLAQLAEGQRLRVTGKRIDHPRFGPQIEVQCVEAILPGNIEGIRAYLASSLVKGIGPAIAQKITDRFGEDTLRIIEEEPERLHEVRGLGRAKITELCDALHTQRDVQEVMVFLRAHGLGQALASRIVKRYGKGAAAFIQANPYRLAEDVIGIGFKTADKLAAELGIPTDSPERIRAGALHCLSQAARNGHCFLPRHPATSDTPPQGAAPGLQPSGPQRSGPQRPTQSLVEATSALLGLTPELVDAEVPALESQGHVRLEQPPGSEFETTPREWVYPTALHMAEIGVTKRIRDLLRRERDPRVTNAANSVVWYESRSGMQLPDAQREAVIHASTAPLSVITGGPGVGKTTTIRAIAEIANRDGHQLLLCAPTGRAAKRLEESTGSKAQTIHRLLDWQVSTGQFARNQSEPLEGAIIVVDEISMLDLQLAYNLLRAIPDTMRVVLVGDVDQLPSVGPGQVLRDIIDSEAVPVTRLVEVFRQQRESLIIQNAHALLEGQTPQAGGEDSDFYVVESRSNQHTRDLIRELVARRIPRKFELDPMRDIQVLCPMYRGHAGADTINADLQEALNPGDRQIERRGKTFRQGDRVMQIRNDYDLELYNGDTGRITQLDKSGSSMLVRFGSRTVDYPFAELDALVPGYAITVHRAQGSEYPAVVIPLATDHYMMLRRNLLYTAITRARKLVILVGSTKALEMAVRNNEEAHRFSGLRDRLKARE